MYNHDEGGDPFLREARFHVRFERVHPFEDGNGRTGRILVNRGLMRAGLAPVVILVEERAAYMDLLARSDYDGLAAMLRPPVRGGDRAYGEIRRAMMVPEGRRCSSLTQGCTLTFSQPGLGYSVACRTE